MRRGFGLPQVLLIILFIGGIVTVTMRYASLGAKHYADSYTREQAELFMQSATEAALFRISGYDRSANTCLQFINISSSDGRFDANITVNRYYLVNEICNNVNYTTIQTDDSHGMIDMTVVVTSKDPKLNPSLKLGNKIRLQRRSLQRP
ncbi:MAG: hypothetical protein WCW84_02855 [Sulfurimonas sp.]|jgi:hypothetical protein